MQASEHLLGGVPMAWMAKWPGRFPVFVREAHGARVDRRRRQRYVDLAMGDTGAMCGHALPFVTEAIAAQAARGITTMLPSEDAAWVAAELARRFGLPVWQFAMTATDANRFALRLARHRHRSAQGPRARLVLPRHGRRDAGHPRGRSGRGPPREHGPGGRPGPDHQGRRVQRRRRAGPRWPARRHRLRARRAGAHEHRHRAARAGVPRRPAGRPPRAQRAPASSSTRPTPSAPGPGASPPPTGSSPTCSRSASRSAGACPRPRSA